jgi:hypothetical protein
MVLLKRDFFVLAPPHKPLCMLFHLTALPEEFDPPAVASINIKV